MPNKTIPAVSIIIPMYNAEKYIGACLTSILAQTFQDFEVIVVDDCSTDKSVTVVENYLPKFNGGGVDKLQLLRRKNNSGNPAEPTNEGLKRSRGEYVFLLDNDDIITKTALAELYPLAKKFDADVVHCEKYYHFHDGESIAKLTSYESGKFATEPTLITDDLLQRVLDLQRGRFLWNLWTKLIRRDFLFDNHIEMVGVMAQDVLFTWYIVLSAKKYLRVPNVVNVYRLHSDSLYHKKEDVQKTIQIRVKAVAEGFKRFNEFLSGIDFFQKRLDVKYSALNHWVNLNCHCLNSIYTQIPAWQFDKLIHRYIDEVGNETELTTFLFSRMNVFNVQLNRQGAQIQQMSAHIHKQNQVIQQLQAQLQQLKS